MSARFEILPGLPGDGPMHESFGESNRGLHREGFVVRFFPTRQDSWVGNFQPGQSGVTGVFAHPDLTCLFVLVKGLAYIIDPESKRAVGLTGGRITEFVEISEQRAFLASDGLRFTRLDASGVVWRSSRISWDGFRNVQVLGETVTGEAFSPITYEWTPFVVDLQTGATQGGSYDGGPE